MEMPYIEDIVSESIVIRTFSPDIDDKELQWHWDKESRIVEPLNENDWFFQFDNGLPFPIREKINIPTGVIHRVIKGNTILKVKITKET
jgi:hypothetical protein